MAVLSPDQLTPLVCRELLSFSVGFAWFNYSVI
jgi:hypothetical protein